MGNITNEEYLNELNSDIILHDELTSKINMHKRNYYLSMHPYSIWESQKKEGKKGSLFYTYLPDSTKQRGIRLIKRTTKESLENVVIEYWKQKEETVTVSDAFYSWVQNREGLEFIAKATVDKYTADFKRFYGNIQDQDLRFLSAVDLANHLENVVSKLHLTQKSYCNMKTILKGILRYAKKHGIVKYSFNDVIDNTEIPKRAFGTRMVSDDKEVFSDEELDLLLPYLINNLDPKNLCLLLTFLTGCRIGESTTAKHSDFVGNTFRVSRTQTRFKDENGIYQYEIKESPKTEAGIRSTVIPTECSWILDKIKECNSNSDYVFLDKNGKPFSCNVMNNRLHRICKKLGIVPKSPHKLRKTYASLLLDNGLDNNLVTTVMGHEDITTTERYYHKNRKSQEQMIVAISDIPQFQKLANL